MGNWQNRDKKVQKRRDTKRLTRQYQKSQKESYTDISQRQKRQEVLHKRQEQEGSADDLDMEA